MTLGRLISHLRDGDLNQQMAAAERLEKVGGRAAVDALTEGLDADAGMVGSRAALALAHIGDDLAIERVFDAAGPGRPAKRRAAAAAGLGEIARIHEPLRTAAIDALKHTLDLDDSYAARSAVEVLVDLADDRAVDALLAAIRGEHSANAQQEAARTVTRSSLVLGPRALDARGALITALGDERARSGAARTLAQLPGGIDVLLGELEQPDVTRRRGALSGLSDSADARVVPALIEALDDEAIVAAAAAAELGRRRDPAALPALKKALHGDASWMVAEALTEFGPDGISALVDASALPDPGLHALATRQLERLGDAAAAPVSRLLAEPTPRAIAAARVAGELALADTRDALVAAVASDSPELRIAALDALARVAPPRVAPTVLACFDDEEPEIRAAAARALAAAPVQDSSARALTELLSDEDASVRAAAADALASAASGREAPLVGLLHDDDPTVRAAAATALGSGRSRKAVDSLVGALTDSVPDVRAAASAALASLGRRALGPLDARLGDARREVREAVALALGEIGEPAHDVLVRGLGSDDPRRRASATAALARSAGRNRDALVTVLDQLRDSSPEVRREAMLGIGRLTSPELSADLARVAVGPVLATLGGDDPSLSAAAAGALLALGTPASTWLEAGPGAEVAEAIVGVLEEGPIGQRRAMAGAIAMSLHRLDPAHEPFPGWFWVSREYAVIHPAPAVSAVMAALVGAVEGPDPVLRELAGSALKSARSALAAKRAPDALVDEHVMYAFAPESNLGEPLPEEQRAQDATTAEERRRSPRYADLTLFHNGARLPEHQALYEGQGYELEVAVRRIRTGLAAETSADPIVETRAAETIEVLVVIDADGVDVEPSLGWLRLPPEGDSVENARFPFIARRPSASEASRAEISVRLFYGFNLLESLRIRAEVVSRLRPGMSSQLGLEQPITLEQDCLARGYARLEDTVPRAMHIHVEQADGAYRFSFTMPGPDDHELVLTGVKRLSINYMESRVVRLRSELDKLTLGAPYATALQGSKSAFHDALVTLTKLGRELWTDLFRSDPQSSLWRIGEWIEANPPPPESLIQISPDASASDFVFPWSFLYDRPLPTRDYEDPDPDGFWGLRYVVEQQAPGLQQVEPDVVRSADGPLSLAYMLWSQFPNAAAHSSAIANLGGHKPVRAVITNPPVEKPSACIELIQDGNREDVLYFFAHGSTRRPATAFGLDGSDLLLAIYRNLTKEQRQDEEVRKAYEQVAEDGSWLKLTFGNLQLARLKELTPGAIAPLVVLNTCDSVQIIPSFGDDSFVSFFLGWGARTVIGTECRMTVHFAHPFGEALLDAVLDGIPFGVALLRARRHFTQAGNPLGLAYTLYGSASAGFGARTTTDGGFT
jgi:HEAT repeat protein